MKKLFDRFKKNWGNNNFKAILFKGGDTNGHNEFY